MKDNTSINSLNEQTREAWNANAQVWDERMGSEGNDFHQTLIRPPTKKLLNLQPGQKILDIGCGNGLTSRWLASLGAQVLGIDFAEEMITNARKRIKPDETSVEFQVLDATDEKALLELGENSFDAAVSTMALMDMAQIDPLMQSLTKLLRPEGCFVFSVCHPCFNNVHASMVAEMTDVEGKLVTEYSVKVKGYLEPSCMRGLALENQPQAHIYFHRPLHVLLGAAFRVGFVLDALEEAAFPTENSTKAGSFYGWNNYTQIPPVMVVRLRLNYR